MRMFGAAYRNSSNTIEIRKLTRFVAVGDDDFTETFENDAMVEVTILDPKGNVVTPVTDLPGGAWPVVLPYVAGSNGRYALQLPFSLDFSLKGIYRVTGKAVTADGSTQRGFDLPLDVLD